MKKITTRNKMFVGMIVGLIMVVLVGSVFFTQQNGSDLSGAGIIEINPSNPSIAKGSTVSVSAHTTLNNCKWSSADTTIAVIDSYSNRDAVIRGIGSNPTVKATTIKVKCGIGLTTGSTGVTVIDPPTPATLVISPASQTIHVGEKITFSTGNGNTDWSIQETDSYLSVATLNTASGHAQGASVTVEAIQEGITLIVATIPGQTVYTDLTVVK